MVFLANRANLDRRTLLRRLHDRFQTQVSNTGTPVTQVRYQTSKGNKVGVRAAITAPKFLERSYPVETAELHVSFAFPPDHRFDFYEIQWVESERELMVGWHQDNTHMNFGKCHFQIDYQGETVQREEAAFLDSHPLNVFDQRVADLVSLLDELQWENDQPCVPQQAVR